MSVEELLDELDEILDNATGLPMSNKCLVDEDRLREVIDNIRLNMPKEFKTASSIVNDRTDIMNNAKREAESIVKNAEDKSRAMVAQHEITKNAQLKANEILSSAQAKSREMRRAAQDFVDDLMLRADEGLTANLAEIRKTRASLRAASSQSAARKKQSADNE